MGACASIPCPEAWLPTYTITAVIERKFEDVTGCALQRPDGTWENFYLFCERPRQSRLLSNAGLKRLSECPANALRMPADGEKTERLINSLVGLRKLLTGVLNAS